MALFPNTSGIYLSERDREIRDHMDAFYYRAITLNQSFWAEGNLDMRFEAGDQTVWQALYPNHNHSSHNNVFQFNRIRRVVNMISGYQRRNRNTTRVIPIENSSNKAADQFTKVLNWVHKEDSTLETISEAFHGALITGMNLLQLWMDYRGDPVSGNLRVENCSYNSFLIDPYFRKADLSDCSGMWKRSFVSKREAISLIPNKEEEILELPTTQRGGKDDKFYFMPENFNYNANDLLAYDEYYYRDFRTQLLVVDTQSGETQEWTGEEETLEQFLNAYPTVTTIKQEIPTVRLAILVQGKVMYDGPNPLGIDEYPFVPVLGFHRPELPYYKHRIQGVVRDLRDAQYLYNRRKNIELDILESQINSGWKLKENALVDSKEDPFLTGQGRALFLKQEANMSDAEQIVPPQIPPSMFQLSDQLSQEIQQIAGVNEELLGSADDDKAGVLSMLRQGAGLTTLQSLFDQLDHAQKILGKRMITAIQNNFAPGKIKKILQEEPDEQFYNKNFGRYDAVVEEGVNTATQRQRQFAQLLQLREQGLNIPDETIVQAATIENKDELLEAIQKQQEQQQKQQELNEQQQQANIEAMQAQAKESTGQGLERLSRVQENQALAGERQARESADRALAQERAAQARENRMQSMENRHDGYLNLAKALKEMEGVELDNMLKLIEAARNMKAYEQEQERQQEQQQSQDLDLSGPQESPVQGIEALRKLL